MTNIEITLRDATEQDYEFLYDFHRVTLKEYIDQTWGWDEWWQAARFREKFDASDRKIILHNGVAMGCLTVQDKGDHLFLSYIALAPSSQEQGIGTRLIHEILQGAIGSKVPVILKVLKTNPARSLYERLGFKITETSETSYYMTGLWQSFDFVSNEPCLNTLNPIWLLDHN